MSDILIKNMEMPSEGRIINLTICSDGSVINNLPDAGGKMSSYRSERAKAVALPSHGDLIDRKELLKFDNISYIDTGYWMTDYEAVKTSVINNAPVIVEATE